MERESLLAEVDDLRYKIEVLHQDMLAENNKLASKLAQTEETASRKEHQMHQKCQYYIYTI